MKKIEISINKIRDLFEVYIPMLTFSIMFMVFIAQIIARYVVNAPLTWAYEVTVVCFAWTVVLGACYGMRTDDHVRFTLITDHMSKKNAAIFNLIGNIILMIAFVVLISPTIKYVTFMNFQATSVLKIRLSWVFGPIIYFVISIAAYLIENISKDIKYIKNKIKEED